MGRVVTLEVDDLHKSYQDGTQNLHVLKGISCKFSAKTSYAIIGGSGSGKSTLLNILGTLDTHDQGQMLFEGQEVVNVSKFRSSSLGFVFQFHHLLPEFSVIENVAMPSLIAGVPRHQALEDARALLKRFGIEAKEKDYPATLSGGESSRVAIARALINQPKLLLMDEPTGSLDAANRDIVLELIADIVRTTETTLIVVTHSSYVADKMMHRYEMREGVLV